MNPTAKHQSWADVAVFEDLNSGKAMEAFLKDKGLEARTYDDKWFRYFLFLRPPRVTYRVQVRQNHFQDVCNSLDTESPDALQKAVRCPSCNSLHIQYPQMTRKFILPTILLHLGIIFHLIDHEAYCENCHYLWNLSDGNVHPVSEPVKQFP